MGRVTRLISIATTAASAIRNVASSATRRISGIRETVREARTAVSNIADAARDAKSSIADMKSKALAELNDALSAIRGELDGLRSANPQIGEVADDAVVCKAQAALMVEKEVISAIAEIECCAAELTAEIECAGLEAA